MGHAQDVVRGLPGRPDDKPSGCPKKIQLLTKKCPAHPRQVLGSSCHQPPSKQSDLNLTSYARFEAGGKRGGPVFVASWRTGGGGLVIQFITSALLKPSMPLGQPPASPATDVFGLRWLTSINSSTRTTRRPTWRRVSRPFLAGHRGGLTALRFSPDGQMLAVSGNREVLLSHMPTGAAW